jgi:opacity protein-like surface antigen
MKKMFTFVLFSLFVVGAKNSSAQVFQEKKIFISAGYGAPNFAKLAAKQYKSELNYKIVGSGPIHIKGEYAINKLIGVGLSINYSSVGASWNDTVTVQNGSSGNYYTATYDYKLTYSSTSFNPRLNLHFANSEKFDAYWGIGLGFRTGKFKITSNNPVWEGGKLNLSIPFGLESTLGMRYFFTNYLGLYSEFGLSRSLIQLGLVGRI